MLVPGTGPLGSIFKGLGGEEVARAGMAAYMCSLLLECEVGGTVSVEEVKNWDNLSPFLVLAGPMVS